MGCSHCNYTGIRTKPEAPPDEEGNYTAGHVRAWLEFMRRLGYPIRAWKCRCVRRKAL